MTSTGPILLPVRHRRRTTPLRCRLGLHDWIWIGFRQRCLTCPAVRDHSR